MVLTAYWAETTTPRNRQTIRKYLLVKPFLVTDKERGEKKREDNLNKVNLKKQTWTV